MLTSVLFYNVCAYEHINTVSISTAYPYRNERMINPTICQRTNSSRST